MDDALGKRGLAAPIGRRSFLGLALAGVFITAGCTRSNTTKLSGTQLDGRPAPDFALTDQNGAAIALSDFRGKAVALSFIFTNCPDICPLIASQMRAAWDLLPEDRRDRVALLGVSVDPERDTPEALRSFSARFELDDVSGWHALTGTRPELEAVWASYGIESTEVAAEVDGHINGAARVPSIRHTDAIYLIDGEGKQRSFLRSNVDPQDLANDLRALT